MHRFHGEQYTTLSILGERRGRLRCKTSTFRNPRLLFGDVSSDTMQKQPIQARTVAHPVQVGVDGPEQAR
jgi:hypothetical protein